MKRVEEHIRKLELASGIAGVVTGNNQRNRIPHAIGTHFGETTALRATLAAQVCAEILCIVGGIVTVAFGIVYAPFFLLVAAGIIGGMLSYLNCAIIAEAIFAVPIALTVMVNTLSFFLLSVPLAMFVGLTVGIGTGLLDAYKGAAKNRNALFNHRSIGDVNTSLITAVSSCAVSLFFVLEHIVKFLWYLVKTLGSIITLDEGPIIANFGLAVDSCVKIFNNLTAAILHPVINLCMAGTNPISTEEGEENLIGQRP